MPYLEIKIVNDDHKKHINDVEKILQEFKKQMKKSGILEELRKREYYLSPSKARRVKHNNSIKQRKRDERKAEWHAKNDNDW